MASSDWYSILVRTAVYRAGLELKYVPRTTVDVLEAVHFGIEREMEKENLV